MLRRVLPRALPLSVHLPSLATPTTTAVPFVSPPGTQCAVFDHHHHHHGAADYCARLHALDDAPPRHQTTKARYADLLLSPCCCCYTSLLWRSTALRPTIMLRGPHTASRTAKHKPLSFYDRKEAFLTEMYYKRNEIFAHPYDKRLEYVNDTIGDLHKVALTDTGAVTVLYDYLNSADSQTDLVKYIKKVNEASIPIKDVDFTYEQLLMDRLPDKKSMTAPWNNLVPREVSFDLKNMKSGPVEKWRMVIALFGSSGCGKTEALNAVSTGIIMKLPSVLRVSLKCPSGINYDSTSNIDASETLVKKRDTKRPRRPIPSVDEQKEKKKEMDWQRNCAVAETLLEKVDSLVGRRIAEEVERGAPLPNPKKFTLLVTLDEIGREPKLARALVSISRQLNGDGKDTEVPPAVRMLRKVFGLVVIVLAGTTSETIATSEQGSVVVTDPTMVHFYNMDMPQCVSGKRRLPMSREEYRKALVYNHIRPNTHRPWLAGRLLQSRLRIALDNPRIVKVVADMTALKFTSKPSEKTYSAKTIPNASDPANPLSRHEFDQWAPLLANDYCALNGLSNLNPFSEDPRAYSELQLVFLRAHYVWDHHASDEMQNLVNEVLTSANVASSSSALPSRSYQANCLLEMQQLGLLTFLDGAEGNAQQTYRVSIPPSLPYLALAALDCTVGFGGGGWSAWEDAASQSVGLRFAAAMAWKGCATVGDAVPGLYVPLKSGYALTWPIASVAKTGRSSSSSWTGRHWCAVVAPIQLCGYAPKKFNKKNAKDKIVEKYYEKETKLLNATKLQKLLADEKTKFDALQAEKKRDHKKKVGTYWKKEVLPLLKKHSIVLVQNRDKAPAADCFALIRVNRKSAGKPILVVAQLQMKDFSYSSAPKTREEMAKMGFATTESRKIVNEICQRSTDHRKIMQAAFPKYKLFFGAVICMSRAEPNLAPKHPWSSLATLQRELGGNGVLYATPVQQCVFYPNDAPAAEEEDDDEEQDGEEEKEN